MEDSGTVEYDFGSALGSIKTVVEAAGDDDSVILAVKTTQMSGCRMLERGPVVYMSGGGL